MVASPSVTGDRNRPAPAGPGLRAILSRIAAGTAGDRVLARFPCDPVGESG